MANPRLFSQTTEGDMDDGSVRPVAINGNWMPVRGAGLRRADPGVLTGAEESLLRVCEGHRHLAAQLAAEIDAVAGFASTAHQKGIFCVTQENRYGPSSWSASTLASEFRPKL